MQLSFTLPFALKGLNARQRMHWAARKRERDDMKNQVIAAIGGTRYLPFKHMPIEFATIDVCRYSWKPLDPDNLRATVKPLLDVLCVQSATHPCGLNIIADDDEKHLAVTWRQERGKPATTVTISW